MKVGIVGITNIEFMPYLRKYQTILQKNNIDYDVLYWNRTALNEEIKEIYIPFNCKSSFGKKKYSKILDFLKYRKFLKNTIREKKYDKLIILTTLPAMLLFDLLLFKYKNNYILDIRDPSYEKFKLFNQIFKKIICSSYFTTISSEGFLEFLPKIEGKYFKIHNFDDKNLKLRVLSKNSSENKIIKIRFHGFIRHIDANKKIIEKLGNDSRFEIHYHGIYDNGEGSIIKEYATSNRMRNVFFHGKYNENERREFLSDTNILHNIYENDATKYALGNKMYDGILYYIPQLVSKGSIMGELVEKHQVGLTLDYNSSNLADEIYIWYQNIDFELFKNNCDRFLEEVMNDEKLFRTEFQKYLSI